tara:strand:+ start:1373 stop:1756 length:384 start_codon:yes stop_codon:yes gene_type:complete
MVATDRAHARLVAGVFLQAFRDLHWQEEQVAALKKLETWGSRLKWEKKVGRRGRLRPDFVGHMGMGESRLRKLLTQMKDWNDPRVFLKDPGAWGAWLHELTDLDLDDFDIHKVIEMELTMATSRKAN